VVDHDHERPPRLILVIEPDRALHLGHPPSPLRAADVDRLPRRPVVMSVTIPRPVVSGTIRLRDVGMPAYHRESETTIPLLVDEKTARLLVEGVQALAARHRPKGCDRCLPRQWRRMNQSRKDGESSWKRTSRKRSWMGLWPRANGRIDTSIEHSRHAAVRFMAWHWSGLPRRHRRSSLILIVRPLEFEGSLMYA